MILTTLSTIFPVILTIVLGGILKRRQFVSDTFWQGAERIGYYLLLPALFFYSLATTNLRDVPIPEMAAVLLSSTFITAIGLYTCRHLVSSDGPAFTSVFQGGVRFNNFIGVTIAASLYGDAGIAIAAVANAVIVPTVNILCVLIFAKCAHKGSSPKTVLKAIVTNPLLVSCVLGVAVHLSGLSLPTMLTDTLKSLGLAASPIGLLCVGAALSFQAFRSHLKSISFSAFFKFLIMPGVTYLACRALGFSGPAASVALVFQALPTASSSYVMAKQLGGDAPLMANIVAAQTLLSGLILPIVIIVATLQL